jgi:hypothetical protein
MLAALVACSGCRSDGSKERQRLAGHFPIVPPITNANPFVRHAVSVRVPTTMRVTRHGDSLAVSFSTAKTNLMVGDRMITGLKREDTVHYDGVAHSLGLSLQSGLAFGSETNILTFARDKVPQPGQEFTLEHRFTIFETDVPAQHMWSPEGGRNYRVLWSQTFRETLR